MYSGQELTSAVLAKINAFCLKFSSRKKNNKKTKNYLYRSSEICKFLIQIWNWSSEWKLYCKISHGFDMRMLTQKIKVLHLLLLI